MPNGVTFDYPTPTIREEGSVVNIIFNSKFVGSLTFNDPKSYDEFQNYLKKKLREEFSWGY